MKFDYSEKNIIAGFEFFGIANSDFIKKTLETAEYVRENGYSDILDGFLTKTCVGGMTREFDGTLWGLKVEDLGFPLPENSYIAPLMMIATWQMHKANMEQFGLDGEQIKFNKMRFSSTILCDVEKSKLPCPRMNRFTWGLKFLNCKIVETGSLQFDFNNGGINFHIPPKVKFDRDSILQTIKDGKKLVKKYYGLTNPEFRCNSWLLSPQIYGLSKEGSNIRAFADMFDITEGANCVTGIMDFLFSDPMCRLKLEDLPETTGLQKSVKEYLLQGKEINYGLGVLKDAYAKGDE